MKITIRVKTNARRNEVMQIDAQHYLVSVNVPPIEGKANEKVIEVLAEYFGKPKINVSIIHGIYSRDKIVRVN
jgi:uncharacterized protein